MCADGLQRVIRRGSKKHFVILNTISFIEKEIVDLNTKIISHEFVPLCLSY
jgi:hypothetical protein